MSTIINNIRTEALETMQAKDALIFVRELLKPKFEKFHTIFVNNWGEVQNPNFPLMVRVEVLVQVFEQGSTNGEGVILSLNRAKNFSCINGVEDVKLPRGKFVELLKEFKK